MTYDAGHPCCAEYGQMQREIGRLRAALKPFAIAGRTLLDEPDATIVRMDNPIAVRDYRIAAEVFYNEQSGDKP